MEMKKSNVAVKAKLVAQQKPDPDIKRMSKEELRAELIRVRQECEKRPSNSLKSRGRAICREMINRIELFMDTIEEWGS